MKQYQIYVGLNDKDTKTQIVKTETALYMIDCIVTAHTDGATITTGKGVYTHDDGTKITENTVIITINDYMDNQVENVKETAEALKYFLNQESVLITATELLQCDLF